MIKQASRILMVLFVILLFQPGCGMVRSSQEAIGPSIVVKKLVETSQSWDGKLLPAYPHGQPKITILRISIPPGFQLHTHHHPVINAGVLISGELTVKAANGKTLHLKAGDPIVELVNTVHYGINQGIVPAEIIVFYAGALDTPITIIEPR